MVAFTGDGANDTGALRQADLSLSLSTSETSIAATYTSLHVNDIIELIK